MQKPVADFWFAINSCENGFAVEFHFVFLCLD